MNVETRPARWAAEHSRSRRGECGKPNQIAQSKEEHLLELSKTTLSEAPSDQRTVAEIIAIRYLASELEENLMPADEAAKTAQAHKDADDETWLRAVFGILLGLRSADERGYRVQSRT